MRFIALFLLLAHLGATAGPALETLPEGKTGHHCTLVSGDMESGASGAVEAQKDCDACKTLGCTHAMTCSGVSPAVAPGGMHVLVSSLVVSSLDESGSRDASFRSNPIPPPPRA
jgi:hypothetical protein